MRIVQGNTSHTHGRGSLQLGLVLLAWLITLPWEQGWDSKVDRLDGDKPLWVCHPHNDHQVPLAVTCVPISICQPPLPASASSILAAEQLCRQGPGAWAGTKLVMVRFGMEAHQYPRLHGENCQQGKGGETFHSALPCPGEPQLSTDPGSSQQHPVTGQEATGRC